MSLPDKSDTMLNQMSTLNINNGVEPVSVVSENTNIYESIFSWNIYEKIDKIRSNDTRIIQTLIQKYDFLCINEPTLDLKKICFRLIICYEMFLSGEMSKALNDITSLIDGIHDTRTEMDTFTSSISEVYFHILYATQAFMIASINKNDQQTLENIKQFSNFNKREIAALNAIKATVFMEYPPNGNKIAAELAKSAQNFDDGELLWKNIWLKAKGRHRRFGWNFSFPCREEMIIAKKLSLNEYNPEYWISAAKVIMEAASLLKQNCSYTNLDFSNFYYGRTINLILKVCSIAENDLKLLANCLEIFLKLPKNFRDENLCTISNIVKQLNPIQNNRIHQILGQYSFKVKRDFLEAKMHFTVASSNGLFKSSIQLLKVQRNIKSNFSVLDYLKSLYKKYDCPKRRLIITSQILLYYIYNKNNPKEILHYLKIFLNEDISYALMKKHIIVTIPLFKHKGKFKPNSFMEILIKEIIKLKAFSSWESNEQNILETVISKFDIMAQENILECSNCYEDNITKCVLFQPCKHKICVNCLNTINKTNYLICPICLSQVIYTVHS